MCKIFVSELGSKSRVIRGFKKGTTLGGRTSRNDHIEGLQKGVAKKFSKLGSKSGVMRGFQKGITLGGRTSTSDHI